MQKINISNALPPGGHYTPAVISNGLVFTSGILPIDLFTGEKINMASFEVQTEMVLDNLEKILQAAGSSLQQLVKVTVFIKDIDRWNSFNNIYIEKLGTHKPARTVIPVNDLHFGFLIELDAIAEI